MDGIEHVRALIRHDPARIFRILAPIAKAVGVKGTVFGRSLPLLPIARSRFGSYTSQIAPPSPSAWLWNTFITAVPRPPLPMTPSTTWFDVAVAPISNPLPPNKNVRLFISIAGYDVPF